METSLIEKMNKSRYSLIKWFTISWAVWVGGFILKDFIGNKYILAVAALIGLLGWIIWFVNFWRLQKLGKVINSDSKLKDALSDELFLHNRNKSFIIGFWTLIVLIIIFLGLSIFTNITALIVCEITLYFGVLSILVSSLIYNRA